MSMSPEERRLIHQKGQQPTYGIGKPESAFGKEGDISYRKIDKQTVQFLKQDGEWVEISSSDNAGNISSELFGDQYLDSDTAFLNKLRQYRSTIASWSRDYCVHHNFHSNFGANDDEGNPAFLQIYLHYNIGYTENNNEERSFILSKSTFYKSVCFYFTTAQNNTATDESTGMRLTLLQSKESTLEAQGDYEIAKEVNFGITVLPGTSHCYSKVILNTPLISTKSYAAYVSQVNFNSNKYVLKYGNAVSLFSAT
tara:strand:- start:348 stop:1109 length:762 start_codon:yes stop_codon:yes gene_type:complete